MLAKAYYQLKYQTQALNVITYSFHYFLEVTEQRILATAALSQMLVASSIAKTRAGISNITYDEL